MDGKAFVKWIFSSLLNAGFLIIWVFIQWVVNTFLSAIPLEGVDSFILEVFRVLFAMTTLFPVVAYVIVDSTRIFFQAKKTIRKMNNSDESNEEH